MRHEKMLMSYIPRANGSFARWLEREKKLIKKDLKNVKWMAFEHRIGQGCRREGSSVITHRMWQLICVLEKQGKKKERCKQKGIHERTGN